MKALSLLQPWASLVAVGAKKIETRSWRTNYRGPLAIHASRGWTMESQDLCDRFRFNLETALPFGAIIATADLIDCMSTSDLTLTLTMKERAFGDYSPGRFAWILANVHRLDAPIHCKGRLGIWDVPAQILARHAVAP